MMRRLPAMSSTRVVDGVSGSTEPLPRKSHSIWSSPRGISLTLILALIVAGWFGVDDWFYHTVSLRTNTPDPIDMDFYSRTRAFWELMREFGSPIGGVIAFVAIGLLHSGRWRAALCAAIAVLPVDLLAFVLQGAIGRVRPNQAGSSHEFLSHLSGLWGNTPTSFPSGEATAAFTLATVLAVLFPRGSLLFFALAFLTGVSRLLHGAHYVGDVAAGAFLAIALAPPLLHRVLHASSLSAPDSVAPRTF